MCPTLTDLTCYIGDYQNILGVLSAAFVAGLLVGFTVGVLRNVMFKRI